MFVAVCLMNLFLKTLCQKSKLILLEQKTTQVSTLYSNNMATYRNRPVLPRHQQEWQDLFIKSHIEVFIAVCLMNLFLKTLCQKSKLILLEHKTTQVSTLYSNNMATYRHVLPRHQQEWQDRESSEAHSPPTRVAA